MARTCVSPAPGGGCRADPLRSVELTPARLDLAVGGSATLSVAAVLESGTRVPLALGAAFLAQPAGVVHVDGAGALGADAAGEADVRAYALGLASNPCHVVVTVPVLQEARGIWVTRWDYRTEAQIRSVLQTVAAAGFNQVYWQVRGRADAFYRSTLEPWGSELTGTLGQDPGFDPLQTALDQAHALGLELHAWVNTFPAWTAGTAIPDSTPPHPLQAHPDWVQVDGAGNPAGSGYLALSPGNLAVREHIQAVLTEISAYDIDGLHLDYIRYSGSGMSHDAASETAYQAARAGNAALSYGDFQRDCVADMVARARAALSVHHPERPLSAAVWFVYENTWGWSGVSQGNVDYYQDTERWLAAGSVDVLVPMLYFPLTSPPGGKLDFLTLVEDHAARAGRYGRAIYAGYEVRGPSDTPLPFAETAAQVQVAREHGALGTVNFAYSAVAARDLWSQFAAGPFAQPAAVPVLPWLAH